MNINERLQEIEEGLDNDIYGRLIMSEDSYKWMHDTINQLQEENEREKTIKIETYRANAEWQEQNEKLQKRIEELEELNHELVDLNDATPFLLEQAEDKLSQITAAHEAFLKDMANAMIHSPFFRKCYDKHFSDIYLAEQVRLAKLSAGVDGK